MVAGDSMVAVGTKGTYIQGLTQLVQFLGSAVIISKPLPLMHRVRKWQEEFLIMQDRRSTGFSVRWASYNTSPIMVTGKSKFL